MSKPENVNMHWHYFPEGATDDDDQRIDVCELNTIRFDDPKFVVWILETDVCIYFNNYNEALVFTKDFIFGRYIKRAVDMSGKYI